MKKPEREPIAFGYVRVSTNKQAQHGTSMEAQPDIIRRYAAFKGLPEPLIFQDPAEQGTTPFAERPAASEIIKTAQPGDHVLVTKLDRGFRNLADFLHWFDAWSQTGVLLHVIDFGGISMDPRSVNGRLLYQMFAVIAEWERGQISMRVQATVDHLKSQGLHSAPRVRTGFKAVKNPNGKGFFEVPDLKARALMGQILEWSKEGITAYQIAQHLRVTKVPVMGKKEHYRGVKRMWEELYVRFLIKRETEYREAERKIETPEPEKESA